jgi:small subunit ribosomal protein S16
MATKIRLQRHGRGKRPFYYVVVADSRARRDGKFIDRIGDYNPLTVPATINIDFDKAFQWVMNGAEPTDTVRRILSYKGVMYKKHLARGLRKGALTEEQMEKMMNEWFEYKENKIATRVEKLNADKDAKKAENFAAETKKREEYADKLKAAEVVEEEAPIEENVVEEAPIEENVVVEESNEENVEQTENQESEVTETPAE